MTIETAPASLSGLRELEDHGQRGLARETSLRVNRRSNLALRRLRPGLHLCGAVPAIAVPGRRQ